MRLNITDLSYEPRWFDFEQGARLQIRPYPFSQSSMMLKEGGFLISGKDQCEVFKHCLVGWENVLGADGKPLPCTDDVKQKLYDFRVAGIPDFVLARNWGFQGRKAEEEKNS